MGLFSSPEKQKEIRPDFKPIKRAKIVGVRPSYFNPHAITGATHADCVFFDVVFEYEDGSRKIYSLHGKCEMQQYLQYLNLD